MSRIAPRKRTPSGRIPGWMKVATLHVSIAEKIAGGADDDQDRADPGEDLPHLDQPAIGRGHQQGDRIAGRGQQRGVDDVGPAEIVGEAGEGAEHEITAPAERLQRPEGAVLVLEKGPAVQPERVPAGRGGAGPRLGRGDRGDAIGHYSLRRRRCSSSGKDEHRPVALVRDPGRHRPAHVLGGQRAIVGEIGADIRDVALVAAPNSPAPAANSRWSPAAARCR